MTELSSHLSDDETRALELRDLRRDVEPRARAVKVWLGFAASRGLNEQKIEEGLDLLRTMSTKRLKRVRKQLAGSVNLAQIMPFAFEPAGQATTLQEPTEIPSVRSTILADGKDRELAHPEATEEPEEMPHEKQHSSEEQVSEKTLSENGKNWAVKILGDDYDFEQRSAEGVAMAIWLAAGSPKTRRQSSGKKVDPIKRILMRLQGATNSEIAQHDEVTREAVGMWFRSFIEKKIKNPSQPSLEPDTVLSSLTHGESVEGAYAEEEQYDVLLESLLLQAGFSNEEVAALKTCIEFDDQKAPKIRPPEAGDAINKLQKELIANAQKLDNDDDQPVLASLRMLTTTVFGQKTIRDVYHKLHGKDPSITHEDVTKLLRDGIIKLIDKTNI